MAARIQCRPAQPAVGEVVEVRIIIGHPMESGQRRNDVGERIRQNVVNRLTARYDDAVVFDAEIGTGIAANPVVVFWMRATRSAELRFDWIDDDGMRGEAALTLVEFTG
jgi:sulfur-oxidizing protein SoxZ